MGEVALHFPLWPACLFTDFMGSVLSPLSSGTLFTTLLQAFPFQCCWVGATTAAFSGQLVYLQFCEGLPLPPSLVVQVTHPLCYVSFFVVVIYYSVWCCSPFSLCGVQSVQGAMLIWPRDVCGNITCHLSHLVVCFSRADRSWHLAALEPSWFLRLP
jgi:hypothetical protein